MLNGREVGRGIADEGRESAILKAATTAADISCRKASIPM